MKTWLIFTLLQAAIAGATETPEIYTCAEALNRLSAWPLHGATEQVRLRNQFDTKAHVFSVPSYDPHHPRIVYIFTPTKAYSVKLPVPGGVSLGGNSLWKLEAEGFTYYASYERTMMNVSLKPKTAAIEKGLDGKLLKKAALTPLPTKSPEAIQAFKDSYEPLWNLRNRLRANHWYDELPNKIQKRVKPTEEEIQRAEMACANIFSNPEKCETCP